MRERLNSEIKKLEKIILAGPWENPRFYGDFLAQTYYYVCHSTRLLGLAASRLYIDRDSLHRRFAEHIGEEKSHERLAVADLRALGMKLENFPELPVTRAFYETQYYKIERQDPTALLGYILLLEVLSVKVGPALHQRTKAAHGERASSFLRIHVEEDVDHVAKALTQVDGLPDHLKEYVAMNMEQTAELYGAIINRLADMHAGAAATMAA